MTKPQAAPSEKKLKREQEWQTAQVIYEREPTEDFTTIAKMMKCSRQAVRERAIKMGWRKTSDIEAIVGVAQKQADAKFTVDGDAPAGVRASTPSDPKPAEPKASDPKNYAEINADQKSADLRAAVLTRHRSEWAVPRTLLQESIRGNERDLGRAKLAKVVAETLKITQDGERKAWGLDTGEAAPGAPGAPGTRLLIVREAAPYAEQQQ